jgi:signal transduction histidine kinase
VTSATDPAITADFHEQINREVAYRMPNSVALFVSMIFVAFAIEWYHFPQRLVPLSLCIAALGLTCIAGVVAVRVYPKIAAIITVATVLVLCVGLTMYLALVQNSGELCLLAVIGYLTGLVVQFPWGARYQAAAAAGVIAIYILTLVAGTAHHLPLAYGLFALITHAIMTVLGASLLDRYRWSAFCEAAHAEQLAEEAARANRAKTDFLATVSHELRTPLNIIFGYTDLLMEDAFDHPDERSDAMRRIRAQSGNLLDMIQAMLDINKVEAGGVPIDASEFRLGDLMDHLATAIPHSWCKNGVQLVWQANESDAVLNSDADKIEIVLRNLVHNALKYTDAGEVRVTAAVTPGGTEVDFVVSDTGQGIPADDLDRIFQMFQQSGSGPPRQGGVGLGLFLVKQLTNALGGAVHADSEIGSGSRFTVVLPLTTPVTVAAPRAAVA